MKNKRINSCLIILIVLTTLIALGENSSSFGSQAEHMWHSYSFSTRYGNRQELVIKNITTDAEFNYGANVTKWKSINLYDKTYAVGITKTSVTVIAATYNYTERRFDIEHKITEIGARVADVALFKDFDASKATAEVLVILPMNEEKPSVKWYRINENLELEQVWQLQFHFRMIHVNYMFINDKHAMLLINAKYKNATVVEIYNFDVQQKQITFLQLLHLSVTADNTCFMQFGVTPMLAIPQKLKNRMHLYQFVGNQFVTYKNMTGVNGTQIVSFHGGYNSYIAINGRTSNIFQLKKNRLGKAKMNIQLADVDYWLPIAAKPYSDEPIIFAQRLTNHATHRSYAIDVLLYNNERFKLHDEMNCTFFGEKSNGASCIVEDEQSLGLKGTAVIGDGVNVGLLIPRRSGPSLLVAVNYEMRDLPDPVDIEVERLEITKELIEQALARKKKSRISKKFVQMKPMNWMRDSEDGGAYVQVKYHERNSFIVEMNALLDNLTTELDHLERKIRAITADRRGNRFDTVRVTDKLIVDGHANANAIFANAFNGHSVDDVLNDIVDPLTPTAITSRKTFNNVSVHSLNVNAVNGAKFSEIALNKSDSLTLIGDIICERPVAVAGDLTTKSGLVNGVSIGDDAIAIDGQRIDESLAFDDVEIVQEVTVGGLNEDRAREFDVLQLKGNITVDQINGESLDDFLDRVIVRTDGGVHLRGNITINGTVHSEETYTTYLNGLKFDAEYLLNDSDEPTFISGKKTFSETMRAKEVSTSGSINGIDLNDVITLSNNQTLKGNFRFHDLEITEQLDIEGTVSHSGTPATTKPRATLHQSEIVWSDVIVKSLEVDGSVTVASQFNGKPFADLLEDVVYKDSDDQIIDSVKQFNNGVTVFDNLAIESNSINGLSIDSFITKDTEQVLNMSVLNGIVSIDNLELDGHLNGINVTELDQETVKLTGEQYVSARLAFDSAIESHDLNVADRLNGIDVAAYRTDYPDVMQFDGVHVDELIVIDGHLEAIYSNFDPKEYDNRRLSRSENQTIGASFKIENANAKRLIADNVNGFPYKALFGRDFIVAIMDEKMINGSLSIEKLIINGSMSMDYVNGANVRELWDKCADDVLLTRTMEFNEDVHFEQPPTVRKLCGIDFKEFADNLVYKHETHVNLTMKEYVNGFEAGDIHTDYLNAVSKYGLMSRYGEQVVRGPLKFAGNVIVNDRIDIGETLNNVSMSDLGRTFDTSGDGFAINSDVTFGRSMYVDHLKVAGSINDQNLTDVLQSLVYIRDNVTVNHDVTFEGPVTVEGNLTVANELNGIDFNKLIDDIVFVNADDDVEGLIEFRDAVNVSKLLIDEDLDARFLTGVDLQTWKDNAAFIDRGLISGDVVFERAIASGTVKTKFLNSVNTESFIPLKSDQNITQELSIGTLSSVHNISVGNLVNGYNLMDAYENTLMNEPNQVINGPVAFNGNVMVRDFLTINNLVNGIDMRSVVTTNTRQELKGDYRFGGDLIFKRNLNVHGLVNDVNITEWNRMALKSFDTKSPMTIEDVWLVDDNVTFYDNVRGNALINGLNISELATMSHAMNHFKNDMEKNLVENYNHLCKDMEYFMGVAKKQIYSYKYFDYFLNVDFKRNVETVHHFVYKGNHFVLASTEHNCRSTLMLWANSTFSPLKTIKTGTIKQVITAKINHEIFLVTISDLQTINCKFQGTNVWRINDFFNIELYHKLEDAYQLRDSNEPGTFYAIGKEHVAEYRINSTKEAIVKSKKWLLHEDASGMYFIPESFGIGLAVRGANKVLKLKDPLSLHDANYDGQSTVLGHVIAKENTILPNKSAEIVPVEVGQIGSKILAAVVSEQDFSIDANSDFIAIYEDILPGTPLTKITSNKPSSLTALRFDDNGQTLLVFLEDNNMLQVYEYKGFEGFKHKQSVAMAATKLFALKLPTNRSHQNKHLLGLINGRRIVLLEAVMDGHRFVMDDLHCTL